MEDKSKLLLREERNKLNSKLEKLLFGRIEIKEKDNEFYIFVNFTIDGISMTKNAGLYSKELYNLIRENNKLAKKIKNKIKLIDEKLKNYENESQLSATNQPLCNFIKENLSQFILNSIKDKLPSTESYYNSINKYKNIKNLEILNLKHAWEFILNENVLNNNLTLSLLCQINKIICCDLNKENGRIRTVTVTISGTKWKSEILVESSLKEQIEKILSLNIPTLDKAIGLFLYIIKKQVFLDGNKRTAFLFANMLLIREGKEILVQPKDSMKYVNLLKKFYTNNDCEIIDFLKTECVFNFTHFDKENTTSVSLLKHDNLSR